MAMFCAQFTCKWHSESSVTWSHLSHNGLFVLQSSWSMGKKGHEDKR